VTLGITNGTLTLLTGTGVTLGGNNSTSVTLTGTVNAINALLATTNAVTYKPTPNFNGSSTLTMTSSDGALSDSDTVAITVTPVNDAPVLANGSTLGYTENDAATAINTAITVRDVDNSSLVSATVSITGGFATGQDVLSFTNTGADAMGNIGGVYDGTTGVMTLTSVGGTATLTHWQAALRAVSYSNSSDAPNTASRTVSYVVNDGALNATAVTSTINVMDVNDAPIANGDVSVNDLITTDLLGAVALSNPSVVTTPVIDGSPQAFAVPSGWINNIGTPDIQSTQANVFASSGYTLSNVNGASLNGGTFVQMLHGAESEAMRSDFTGLTVGNTYTYGVQWQQMTLASTEATYSGGELKITIGNASQTYSSTGLSDGWQTALFTFTVTSTSMPVILGINGSAGIAAAGGAIAVDSLTLEQVASAAAVGTVTDAKTVQELFGDTYTDADASSSVEGTFKGVVITSAGTAANATELGEYQYSSDNGTTWTSLASGLTESTAVFLAKTDWVRFSASSANTSLTMKPDLVARLVDSSAGSPSTSGQVVNVSGTNNGGSTPYSGDTVTLRVIPDNTPPTLVGSTPSDNGYLMAVGNDLVLNFSEAVFKRTGLIELYNANGTLVQSFDVASSDLVTGWGTANLMINPTNNLAEGTGYYILIASTAIRDESGNAYAGINDTTTLNFTTAATDGSYPSTILSGSASSYLGASVSSAGDVNGDGIGDFIVGAPQESASTNGPNGGAAYVVYGNTAGNFPSFGGGTIAASAGFKISSADPSNYVGYDVTAIGDINGDGMDDVLVGLRGIGAVYVLYGNSTGTGASIAYNASGPGALTATAGGFAILGPSAANGYFGYSVSGVGDVNGDGYSDFVVNSAGSSSAFVVYGGTQNGQTLNISGGTIDSARGYKITTLGNHWENKVSGAGDVNGDGLADIIVSDYSHSTATFASDRNGRAVVIYSNAQGTVPTDLNNIAASQGFKITAYASNGSGGFHEVSSVGDVNGDGLGDVAVITNNRLYVVFGNATGAAVNFSNFTASQGFTFETNPTMTFTSVASAGDMNGDGLSDILVGNGGTATTNVFVLYGKTSGTPITTGAYDALAIAPSEGFRINGSADTQFGMDVSSAGDVNGDGLDDLIVGAPQTSGFAGGYSIIFGGTQWVTSSVIGSGEVSGTNAAEAIVGATGNDTLSGGGGVDRFFAGLGNDTIVLTASDVSNLANNTAGGPKALVSGGGGFDTIRMSGGAALDLTTISNVGAMGLEENSRIESIERIDLATDTASNTLTLQARDVRDMAGMNLIRTGSVSADGNTWTNVTGSALSATTAYHQLVIDGSSNDTLVLSPDTGAWTTVGTVSNGTSNYTVYQNAATNSQVLVRSGVVVTNNDSVAPVVFDLNRDGQISYSSVTMDVNGDGQLDLTAWAGAQDGVLVWDKYRDGLVHDNSQYAFAQYATTYANGLDANGKAPTDLSGLAEAFDSNRDGVFDAQDAQFDEFKVWQDANQNGVSDAGEVRSLADWGIAFINLISDGVVRTPVAGVTEAGRTVATTTDGQSMLVADAAFAFRDATADEVLSNMFSLKSGLQLDLTVVLNDSAHKSIAAGLTHIDLSADTESNLVSLTMADVLSLSASNGVHQLMLTGAANDKLMLAEGEWTDSGEVVTQEGRSYAVYTGSTDASAQLLIDQHIMTLQANS
jgi:hypothetical protein